MNNNKENLENIIKIVNEADPVGLIALGSPLDEYSSQSMEILSLLEKRKFDDLFQDIFDIFQKSFGSETYIDINKVKIIKDRVEKEFAK